MIESFGPELLRPAQADCPHCACCSAELCRRGRTDVRGCHGHTSDSARDVVRGCPCSAETTRLTAAWRAARIRAVKLARDLPLGRDAEDLLLRLADCQDVADDGPLPVHLKGRGLAMLVGGRLVITEIGLTYIAARSDVRMVTPVRVVDVDADDTRTARVEVPAWRPGEPVTVTLAQILGDTGLTAEALPGRWLRAEANPGARTVHCLVLVDFRDTALVAAAAQTFTIPQQEMHP